MGFFLMLDFKRFRSGVAADTGGAAGDLSMNVQSISSDRRWHSWLAARFSIYEDGTGDLAERNGRFAIAHVGADYLVNEDLAIGVMAQGDWSSEDIDRYSDIEGRGWMIGPYVSGAFSETLFFTGRLAWGESTNDASIDVYDDGNIWSGTFSTERVLAAASNYGVYELGEVQFSPQVDLAYIEESIASYRVSDGAGSVTIESDDLSLLRMSLSGEIEWLDAFPLIEASAFFIPSLDWDIASTGLTTGDDGVRGGVEFGLRSTQGAGWRGEASIAYDGIGQTNFNAWTLRVGAEWHF
ncbi:autotransporter outer membrane beta-barrel domain-containing protein [Maritalea mobilis]|uniref:autotransporter outer membrane beta-barrel domain-containing protein n=1 Tax=Maritalea mobilis TaxID=483324 RepID=UPI001C97C430|nr:autotransporter outer membrane beta-barrel domain-containing protein [Maritalea mobilis]MBY6200573.1 autotransporter outer membrane beta-barrel domain-containing protein [Maritalea mobilis]